MDSNLIEARYWEKNESGAIRCLLCPAHCVLKEAKTGICMAKKNIGGRLIAVAYGLTTSFSLDPMEKKPLYHFYPGTDILSVSGNACNLSCSFCQNYMISQQSAPTSYISPAQLASAAVEKENCVGVAYTYTEPLMWYEYILDAAEQVKKAGLKNVLVTNGYLEPEPYDAILPLIDALNVDIKSMDEEFYKKVCKGKLAPILRNVEKTVGKAHIEITNLVIPGLNDTDRNFEELTAFMAGLDPFMPLHFSRYHPMYKMDRPPTPPETLYRAAEIAKRKLKYVFVGNLNAPGYEDTACPFCNSLLIRREGFKADMVGMNGKFCAKCGKDVRIIR
jgi:pyruvate formate lyase activating enzyme